MCGIELSVIRNSTKDDENEDDGNEEDPSLHYYLKRRGPDALHKVSLTFLDDEDEDDAFPTTTTTTTKVSLAASVLQMRQELVIQPVKIDITNEDDNTKKNENPFSYYLCWNGEVYETATNDNDDTSAGDFTTSDTMFVANRLQNELKGDDTDQEQISNILKDLINAEYAFLILRSDGRIFYGRDPWGRRSLLKYECQQQQQQQHSHSSLYIASVAPFSIPHNYDNNHNNNNDDNKINHESKAFWEEILPGQVHMIDARNPRTSTTTPPTSFPIPNINIPRSIYPNVPGLVSCVDIPPNVSTDMWSASIELETLLSNAVKIRMRHQHETAVLFSGGLDSAVIAAMAARHCTERLYLYNVSFGPTYEKSADRQAAIITHQILQDQYPKKKIIFCDIVVNWEDICKHEPHIRSILQPKATLMDVNIATALWFACGGGKVDKEDPTEERLPKVLLLGMGADELLGGYGRHRKAFENGGWEELHSELVLDQERFWERNLGRDDRMVADHGCEGRFPFLDYHVTTFLQQGLPLSSICDFTLPPGQGDKRILRFVATRLGIDYASGLIKRAIQFGSRISHLSDAKRFGSRRQAKGDASIIGTSNNYKSKR